MKQDVIEYMVDSFIDFKGQERKIVACALSQAVQESEDDCLCIGWRDNDGYVSYTDFSKICRIVSIGISICHPNDEFDEESGKKNAYNRAKYDPKCPTIYTVDKGVSGKHLVKAFLEQEIAYLKENPERYIKGYNKMKQQHEKKETIKTEIANLSDEEKYAIMLNEKGRLNLVKCVELIKKANKAGISIINEQG